MEQKIELVPTAEIVELEGGALARVWKGRGPQGLKLVAFVARLAVAEGEHEALERAFPFLIEAEEPGPRAQMTVHQVMQSF